MPIEIRKLTPESEADYSDLLAEAPAAMFNHSLRYRTFLKAILENAEDHYLLVYEAGELTAALPAFIKHGPLGAVVNSLPFYGSHGGIIAKQSAWEGVKRALLDGFTNLCEKHQAICSTLIESPLATDSQLYVSYPTDYSDERIGQITELPSPGLAAEVEEILLGLYHQKTRNMVRKGMKSGFNVGHDGSELTFKALHVLHDENMKGIGGMAKPWSVFAAINEVFEYDKDYRIYTASNDSDEIVSALLVFYFKGMIEYFAPATLEAYRSQQPLSLLIFTAMRDAVLTRGSTLWNWGGTWLSQDGVYQFKSRWGTTDFPYRYHIMAYRGKSWFSGTSKEDLLNGYPYFFTVPFAALQQS